MVNSYFLHLTRLPWQAFVSIKNRAQWHRTPTVGASVTWNANNHFDSSEHEEDKRSQSWLNGSAEPSGFHIKWKLAAVCSFVQQFQEPPHRGRKWKWWEQQRQLQIKTSRQWSGEKQEWCHVGAGVWTVKAEISLIYWWTGDHNKGSLQKGMGKTRLKQKVKTQSPGENQRKQEKPWENLLLWQVCKLKDRVQVRRGY